MGKREKKQPRKKQRRVIHRVFKGRLNPRLAKVEYPSDFSCRDIGRKQKGVLYGVLMSLRQKRPRCTVSCRHFHAPCLFDQSFNRSIRESDLDATGTMSRGTVDNSAPYIYTLTCTEYICIHDGARHGLLVSERAGLMFSFNVS